MARILVVDNDGEQSMSLGLSLTAKKHVVELRCGSRAAIRAGVRLRPDVLVVDWLLGQPLDGVAVADTIRLVHPQAHAILVTAFPSRDVRAAAVAAGFLGYFTRPISLQKLHAAIDQSSSTPPPPTGLRVGLLEIDRCGAVVHANDRARDLLEFPKRSSGNPQLADVISYRSLKDVDSTPGRWQPLTCIGEDEPTVVGVVKATPFDHGEHRVVLLLAQDERANVDSTIVENLTTALDGDPQATLRERTIEDHVLLVDEDDLQRRLGRMQFEKLGCVLHTAESRERALRLLAVDPKIGVILVDHGRGLAPLGDFVGALRRERPGALLIGTSLGLHKKDFERIGVERFLLKPLVAGALRDAITTVRR